MRSVLLSLVVLASVGCAKKQPPAAAPAPDGVVTCAALKDDACVEPATSFARDAEKIAMSWRAPAIDKGTTVHVVWVAADVGAAAPRDARIAVQNFPVDKGLAHEGLQWSGSSTLSRPTAGWPPGSYRVELWIGQAQRAAATFTIR